MNRKLVSQVVIGLAAGAATLAPTQASHAQVASAFLREGEQLGGAPAGQNIAAINNSAVNHAGGYAFTINTSDGSVALSHVWGNATGGAGAIMRTEGTFPPYTQTSFESFFGIGHLGQVAYSPTISGGPVAGGDSVWRDGVPLAVEGVEMSNVPGFVTQFWRFASRPGISDDGRAYWVGGTTNTSGGTTMNRGLFIEDGAQIIALLFGGQVVPNLPFPLGTGTTVGFDYRFSALATNYIAEVDMASGSTTNNAAIVISGSGLLLDGQLVQEGSPVPASIGGTGGENWQNFGFMGIAADGQYFFTGDTSAAAAADGFLLKNGQMLYREGQAVDGETLTGNALYAYMNEQGDIAFVWAVTDPAGNLEALFLNDELVLIEGDAVDLDGDGAIKAGSVLSDFTGIASLTVSDRDASGNVSIYFTADVDTLGTPGTTDDTEGGFRLIVPVSDCPANIVTTGSSATQVDVDDLLAVITSWGPCPAPPAACPANIATAGASATQVDVDDLLLVITSWGACP